MEAVDKQQILRDFTTWWRDEFAVSHKTNTIKLSSLSEFTINPFLWNYLAFYLRGNSSSRALAEALILPRALGTSVNTIFGTRFQKFIVVYFKDTYGSTTPGVDIEFLDKIDHRKKYCQLKAGPNVVNNDDIKTVIDHFDSLRRLARTNHSDVNDRDCIFALLYGKPKEKNGAIRSIERSYPVYIGQEFWYHFTGDEGFYNDLVQAIGEIANEFDLSDIVEDTIVKLSENIRINYPEVVD
jgi:hypothetical protein